MLGRRKWAVLQAFVVVVAAVVALTLTAQKQYTSSATLLFLDPAVDVTGSGFSDPSRVLATNEELIRLPIIADAAAKRLGGRPSAGEISAMVSIDSSGETDIIDVSAESPDPAAAARVANAYAISFINFVRRTQRQRVDDAITALNATLAAMTEEQRAGPEGQALQARIEELRTTGSVQTGNVRFVQPAAASTAPSSPNVKLNLALGVLLGLLVAAGLAALLEQLDRRIHSVEEVERIAWLPILARIPRSSGARSLQVTARTRLLRGRRRLRVGGEPEAGGRGSTSPTFERHLFEAFLNLRATLHYVLDRGERSLMVVSAVPGEGKSTVAYGLAVTMAASGDRAVFVDADLHKGMTLGAGGSDAGLSTVLAGRPLDDALVEVPVESIEVNDATLTVLPCGPILARTGRSLEGAPMRNLIDELERRFDIVVIDLPALTVLSDGLALLQAVPSVLPVVAIDKTTRRGLADLREQIRLTNASPVGMVVNFAPPTHDGYSYYGRG